MRIKTKQTLQFGKLEMTVSCIIIPIDPIRIITHVWLNCQLCRIGRTQAPLRSKNPDSCFRCIIVQFTYTIHSLAWDQVIVCFSFNMQLVKYFSGAGRRSCPPLKYVTFPNMTSSILSIKNGNSRRAGFHNSCQGRHRVLQPTWNGAFLTNSPPEMGIFQE